MSDPAQADCWLQLGVFLMGMSKGGLPIGSVALSILILAWPGADAARGAVLFMLPLLCVMDLFAVAAYRRDIRWDRLRPLWPGVLSGVLAGLLVFCFDAPRAIARVDRLLKAAVGLLGLTYSLLPALERRFVRAPGQAGAGLFSLGLAAGVTSTIAHAAAPIMQMYLLPQGFDRRAFAGTQAGFFWITNLLKLAALALVGRLAAGTARDLAGFLPAIMAGVLAGYLAVRTLPGPQYRSIIRTTLVATSALLLYRSMAA